MFAPHLLHLDPPPRIALPAAPAFPGCPVIPRARRFALGIVLLAGAAAGAALARARAETDLLASLTRAARGQAVDGARLSVLPGFRACAAGECAATRPDRRVLALFREAEAAAREGTDPSALHAAALAGLLFPPSAGNPLDESISYLQSAAAMSERPAPALADLAGAHLLRAERLRAPQELSRALDAAERALETEPDNLVARFNAGQALDRMGLRREAGAAWTRYLAADPASGWADHARRRLRALAAPPRRPRVPGRTAGAAELERFAAAAPQEARELGWDALLGEWGAAVLASDTATARRRLDQATVLGGTLAARGGDASLADAVDAIRARAAHGAGTRRLARLHELLAQARAAQRRTNLGGACPGYRRVQAEADAPALREWAATFAGLCAANETGTDPAALRELAARADTARHPALAARRWWVAGYAMRRAGRYDQALDAYARAERLCARVGEREYAASMRAQAGNAHAILGNTADAYALLLAGVSELGGHPGTQNLYNSLYALRNATLADGLWHAARRVQDEAVAATAGMEPFPRAEALLARVRLHLSAGRGYASGDMRTAAALADSVADRRLRGWIRADLHEARALARLAGDAAGAAADLDSVVGYFPQADRLVPALFTRAEARLAAGHRDSALADLRRAAELLDAQRPHVESAQLRASLLERSRRVFDRAVMLSVQAGREEEALDFVERSRASFSPVGRAADWVRRPLRAPAGQVAVEFALVGDTLLTWVLWNGGMHLTRTAVDRAELVRTVERVRSALERRAPESSVLPDLQGLYDRLIRPVHGRLGAAGTPLVVVADGELAAVPTAALHDRVRGRYLLEDHPVRFASSLRDAAASPAPPAADLPVTVVADPAFDRGAFPELQPLAGAAAEAADVRRHYPGARVVAGPGATAGTVRAAFARGGIAHFAGHAVFDDARPERSFLLAAGAGTGARLTAAELAKARLDGLRLVVLSACQTSRAAPGRSGGFAGLAGAFLAAGAGGVVGSLWQVDDRQTRVLMDAFHGAYRASGDPAQALRQAQLQMLRSGDPVLRSPTAWAGFRYAGG